MPVAETKGVQQTDDVTFEQCWNGRERMRKRGRVGVERRVARWKQEGQGHG